MGGDEDVRVLEERLNGFEEFYDHLMRRPFRKASLQDFISGFAGGLSYSVTAEISHLYFEFRQFMRERYWELKQK